MIRPDRPDATERPANRRPTRRWSVRHLMGLVIVAAGLLWAYRAGPSVVNFFNDDPHHAFRMVNRSWNLGREPWITVDLFEGGLQVLPSDDGNVHAQITAHAWTKDLQAVADAALDTIVLGMDHAGDTLRITARGASEIRTNGIGKEAGVVLHVPRDVRLDLRTGRGRIMVGRDYTRMGDLHLPIVAYLIRARNDSKYRVGYVEGDIVVESNAPRPAGMPPVPTRLQLDAPGQIDVRADLVTLEAYAWHTGVPHRHQPGITPPEDGEGSIRFEGTLAPGIHSIRAAHDVALKLPRSSSVQIHAEAQFGPIRGNLLPSPITPTADQARWNGQIGAGTDSIVRVWADHGSIDLDTSR